MIVTYGIMFIIVTWLVQVGSLTEFSEKETKLLEVYYISFSSNKSEIRTSDINYSFRHSNLSLVSKADDSPFESLILPFKQFVLFGQRTERVFVGANGGLHVSYVQPCPYFNVFGDTPGPFNDTYHGVVGGFLTDLNPGNSSRGNISALYALESGVGLDYVSVKYDKIQYYDSQGENTFRIELFEDSSIVFKYDVIYQDANFPVIPFLISGLRPPLDRNLTYIDPDQSLFGLTHWSTTVRGIYTPKSTVFGLQQFTMCPISRSWCVTPSKLIVNMDVTLYLTTFLMSCTDLVDYVIVVSPTQPTAGASINAEGSSVVKCNASDAGDTFRQLACFVPSTLVTAGTLYIAPAWRDAAISNGTFTVLPVDSMPLFVNGSSEAELCSYCAYCNFRPESSDADFCYEADGSPVYYELPSCSNGTCSVNEAVNDTFLTDPNNVCCSLEEMDCGGICYGTQQIGMQDQDSIMCCPRWTVPDCTGYCYGNLQLDACGVCNGTDETGITCFAYDKVLVSTDNSNNTLNAVFNVSVGGSPVTLYVNISNKSNATVVFEFNIINENNLFGPAILLPAKVTLNVNESIEVPIKVSLVKLFEGNQTDWMVKTITVQYYREVYTATVYSIDIPVYSSTACCDVSSDVWSMGCSKCSPSLAPSQVPTVIPSTAPSMVPTTEPSMNPTDVPSILPSSSPTTLPSSAPSSLPTVSPSLVPSSVPTTHTPTVSPSDVPSAGPTVSPSLAPTVSPTTVAPSAIPSLMPSPQPSLNPTVIPSCSPSISPSQSPTVAPSNKPSPGPTINPTVTPSIEPSVQPSLQPSKPPSLSPTQHPSSTSPSQAPTVVPSQPSMAPSIHPSTFPSVRPTVESILPSAAPSAAPSVVPSIIPSIAPSVGPSPLPSLEPVVSSLCPSVFSSLAPSFLPSKFPSIGPTVLTIPSVEPSELPTIPGATGSPSQIPSLQPSVLPSMTPSLIPSESPSITPSILPTIVPSVIPSLNPSAPPSRAPTVDPTTLPSVPPSVLPTVHPSDSPTILPTMTPSVEPSEEPTLMPTVRPSITPSIKPSVIPSMVPSLRPSVRPTVAPSIVPTMAPSILPSTRPSRMPTILPSVRPTQNPSLMPSLLPTVMPSMVPSHRPTVIGETEAPTIESSVAPSASPTFTATLTPTVAPSVEPSETPTMKPSTEPTEVPSVRPSVEPSEGPTLIPSVEPSDCPSQIPTTTPSVSPSEVPTTLPSVMPSVKPTRNPTSVPPIRPTMAPTSQYPSFAPTVDLSRMPTTSSPTATPSESPSEPPSIVPSLRPSLGPTIRPTIKPSKTPSKRPTFQPLSMVPSEIPTETPSEQTLLPSDAPTDVPSAEPKSSFPVVATLNPTRLPTMFPSIKPSARPTVQPSVKPTRRPTSVRPSLEPSEAPTRMPSLLPTQSPSISPSVEPTQDPTNEPSIWPSTDPSNLPSVSPSLAPSRQQFLTKQPRVSPSVVPSAEPFHFSPTVHPSGPSFAPSPVPSTDPTTISPTTTDEWVQLYQFSVTQTLNGISLSDYENNADESNRALCFAVIVSMNGNNTHCSVSSVSDSTSRRLMRTLSSGVQVQYAIQFAPDTAYQSLKDSLILATTNGVFNDALQMYAVENHLSGLLNVTSGGVAVSDYAAVSSDDDDNGSDSKKSLGSLAIGLIAAGGAVALLFAGYRIYWHRKQKLLIAPLRNKSTLVMVGAGGSGKIAPEPEVQVRSRVESNASEDREEAVRQPEGTWEVVPFEDEEP